MTITAKCQVNKTCELIPTAVLDAGYSRCVFRSLVGLILLLTLILAGCGGGADTESTPSGSTGGSGSAAYNGPDEANGDVIAFRNALWNNIRPNDRCGQCHNEVVGQDPQFARFDNINLAYQAAGTVVNMSDSNSSLMVTKVRNGHNCWLTSDDNCANFLKSWIDVWAGASSGGGKVIQLDDPSPLVDPTASKVWPAAPPIPTGYAAVHNLLTTHCAGCHVQTAGTPQTPFFANSDPVISYDEVRSNGKIDLSNPANSRLVVRLRDEFHNCWNTGGGVNCAQSATIMQNAIQAFVDAIPDPGSGGLSGLVTSKALTLLGDGIVASGGNRAENNQIAIYEFKTGQGNQAIDTSNVGTALHLTLSGIEGTDYRWVGGFGIEFLTSAAKAQGSTISSKKLSDLIKLTGEYTIEAWVVPNNVVQENTNIISYSAGSQTRNFTLGQTMYNYEFYNRNSNTNNNGEPFLSTDANDQDLQAALQHVVATYNPVNGRRIYVNGVFTGDTDPVAGGNVNNWNDTYALVLGNEVSLDRPWRGIIRLLAIHNRVLTDAQIQQNFDVGVGQKLFMLFGITHLTGMSNNYIMFEASVYDSFSYLFLKPTFISLDPNAVPGNIPIQGMYLGINGKVAPVGQGYRNLDTPVTSSQYNPATGQVLSNLGTIIALENGPNPAVNTGLQPDQFFLAFENINGNTATIADAPPSTNTPPDPAPVSDIGVRIFAEINATMSAVTGISMTNTAVDAVYTSYEQQLPAAEDIEGFLGSHQLGISQLAIAYCDQRVQSDLNPSVTPKYFSNSGGDFDFTAGAQSAFSSTNQRNRVIDPLLEAMINVDIGTSFLLTQPTESNVRTELDRLMVRLTDCSDTTFTPPLANCGVDGTARTAQVVTATCAALLSTGAELIQ